ncbi:MAG: HipA domain-containing protein [Paludibacteraceae bacterium]|nr:HipA domain-containing protein [Paludibacteraceae bacterium]
MCKCLFCYKNLEEGQTDFHPKCVRKFFGTLETPLMEYKREDLDILASQIIHSQTTLTGVQPKLSLNLHKHDGCNRLTIVGLWGDFIFKPQTDDFLELPENEDLTMRMAEAVRIQVVPHSLIRLADGSLGYITRRIDRTKEGEKIDMEDFCQLTLHPTEYKYKSSYEQIAKAIASYSSMPKLDLVNYMQVLLFSFITGNNDMHLKNFSLYCPKKYYQLTPAYDLLNVAIANPKDKEELALSLNGKKSNLKMQDFLKASATMGIDENITLQMIYNMRKAHPKWIELIKNSFLSEEMQEAYLNLLNQRFKKLNLI